jgi:hypothetical protein
MNSDRLEQSSILTVMCAVPYSLDMRDTDQHTTHTK